MAPAENSHSLAATLPGAGAIAASGDYVALRDAIVERGARDRAARAINTELVLLYWSIGRAILAEQERHGWGDDVVGLLAQDLRAHGQLGRGFSRRNLFYMRKFARLWPDEQIVQPLAAQIGWTHHQALLDAFGEDRDLYAWYAPRIRTCSTSSTSPRTQRSASSRTRSCARFPGSCASSASASPTTVASRPSK